MRSEIVPEAAAWNYRSDPPENGDQRKICTIEQDAMVYVGIAIWQSASLRWMQNGAPILGRVLAWRDLPQPATGRWVHGELLLAEAPPPQPRAPGMALPERMVPPTMEQLADAIRSTGHVSNHDKWEVADAVMQVIAANGQTSEGMVQVSEERLRQVRAALDSKLGDTDPYFPDGATDDDVRNEEPIFWACQQIDGMLDVSPGERA